MGKPKPKPQELMLKVGNIIPLWRSVIPNINQRATIILFMVMHVVFWKIDMCSFLNESSVSQMQLPYGEDGLSLADAFGHIERNR